MTIAALADLSLTGIVDLIERHVADVDSTTAAGHLAQLAEYCTERARDERGLAELVHGAMATN